jgi:hypothetical protein
LTDCLSGTLKAETCEIFDFWLFFNTGGWGRALYLAHDEKELNPETDGLKTQLSTTN